jgi:hypothetical protein
MLSVRLLPLLCLLCWSSLSLGRDKQPTPAVPEKCSVTKPADRPFVPPGPHPARPSPSQFWFGTDRLWTALPQNGAWVGLPHYIPSDPTFRQKLLFWRQGFDAHAKLFDAHAKLTVSGRRIDSLAQPLQTDGPGTPSWTTDDQFLVAGINFPTIGCWEITARYENDELTFVVWVGEK